jgi:hypothetical protein
VPDMKPKSNLVDILGHKIGKCSDQAVGILNLV